ncbi:restriction endonuclease subunit S [Listeria monocytogenes]|nr:restriction endonuclease subunit S [Listeria monocytogenes]EAA0018711.1 restriction endonuclease subunit S [Listeria monocytogenes]EAA0021795.1 restriction endonuclease subunit S [Listeria monocytogenes]EAA0046540.1 restriction endonuclease subunit S [Listeria monocytogenes]EAA0055691.1 restriction endonuclease subunit S [Listeria monocytogenes]
MNKKVPKRRFEEFNNADDWEQRKFEDCFNFPVSTNSLSRVMLNYDKGEVKNVHYGDVLIKYPCILNIKKEEIPYITGGCLEAYKSNLLENGDLIFADAAEDETVGKAVEVNGITNENLVSGLHTIVARATTQKAKYFLGYYINSDIYHRQLLRLMQGSKVSAISKGNLQKTDVSFPKDIEEQQKIGSYFKKLDDTIVLYQRKLEKIKALKTAYLSEMFPAEGETKPKRRFAGFTDDWEQRKLGDIANYRNGKAHEQVEDEDGKYTIINSKFISTNGKVQRYTNEQVEPIFDGEIAMVLSDLPNGKALAKLFLVKEDGKYTLNQRIAGITPNENIDPIFLNFRMNRNNYFLKFDSGVTQTNLSKSQVENFIALYPTFDEQYKIGLFFTQLDDTIALHQRKLQKLQNIKKAYLNEMFI